MDSGKVPLTYRIQVPSPTNLEPEDIFESSFATIFIDDIQNTHGRSGGVLFYQSPRFGHIKIHLPQHPSHDDAQRLFAHFLWNAGVLLADNIEEASNHNERLLEYSSSNAKYEYWDVRSERVLELGAGMFSFC